MKHGHCACGAAISWKGTNPRVYCDDCRRDRKLASAYRWRARNPEKCRAQQRRYRETHPEAVAANLARWYIANRKDSRKWQAENKRRAKAWRARNREHIKSYNENVRPTLHAHD